MRFFVALFRKLNTCRQAGPPAVLFVVLFAVFWLPGPVRHAGADQCDQLYELAMSYVESAEEVYNTDADYSQAADLFCEAAGYFELILRRIDCADQRIWQIAVTRADYYNERAIEAENIIRYVSAMRLYLRGDEAARQKDWDRALSLFAGAAELWETVGLLEPAGENGRRALEAARHTGDVIARARRFQASLEFGQW